MKYLMAIALCFTMFQIQAATKEQLEKEVGTKSKKLFILIKNNNDKLSKSELKRVKQKLISLINLVKMRHIDNPQQPTTPIQGTIACSNARNMANYQQTFTQIKDFAYQSDGLNLTSSGAKDFAENWTQKFPCNASNKYIKDFKRLKTFAYESTGLNMTSAGAIEFATGKIQSFCSRKNLEDKFRQQFNFAYSSQGLNMTTHGAREYAKEKTFQLVFNCNNF